MLWLFLLALILGLVFGWHVAALLLVLWLIGFVAFWLFMLFKPVTGPPAPEQKRPAVQQQQQIQPEDEGKKEPLAGTAQVEEPGARLR
jgi:predicted lipid-binding transport protein (Tim44 family)